MRTDNISSEQIQTFRSLFMGRNDAYGTMGFNHPLCVREPLTDDELRKHLAGKKRIGLYLVLPGDIAQCAVYDVDQENDLPEEEAKKRAIEKATKIYVACLDNNLFCYLENSKKRGFHNWLFFDEPLPVKDIRKALLKILRDVDVDCELFPKQDRLTSNDGMGNFIFLPFHGQSVKEKRTVFLNSQLQPYDDQWGQLVCLQGKMDKFF